MSAFLRCVVVALALQGAAGFAAKAADCEGPVTADEILKAEDARYAVQANQDFDAMQRIFADDLVYIHSTSEADNKTSYIERQRAGLRYRSISRGNASVRVFGCVGIITGTAKVEVSMKDTNRSVHLAFHSIWTKRGADLRFTSWESTNIPAK